MTTPNPQVRRATIEDLPRLIPLWQKEGLAWEGLEKRFKEFQIVEDSAGQLLGALGLQVIGTEGRLHSEVFAYPEQADALRDQLWERVQVIARNYGLVRVWCQFTTPFWNHCGFQYADGGLQAKLPPAFAGESLPWRFCQLKEETASPVSIEKEFAVFKEMEKQRTDRWLQQAKVLKWFAGLLVLAVFLLLMFGVLAWFRARATMPR